MKDIINIETYNNRGNLNRGAFCTDSEASMLQFYVMNFRQEQSSPTSDIADYIERSKVRKTLWEIPTKRLSDFGCSSRAHDPRWDQRIASRVRVRRSVRENRNTPGLIGTRRRAKTRSSSGFCRNTAEEYIKGHTMCALCILQDDPPNASRILPRSVSKGTAACERIWEKADLRGGSAILPRLFQEYS